MNFDDFEEPIEPEQSAEETPLPAPSEDLPPLYPTQVEPEDKISDEPVAAKVSQVVPIHIDPEPEVEKDEKEKTKSIGMPTGVDPTSRTTVDPEIAKSETSGTESTGKRRRKRKPKPDYDPEAAARAELESQGEEGGGYGGLGFF